MRGWNLRDLHRTQVPSPKLLHSQYNPYLPVLSSKTYYSLHTYSICHSSFHIPDHSLSSCLALGARLQYSALKRSSDTQIPDMGHVQTRHIVHIELRVSYHVTHPPANAAHHESIRIRPLRIYTSCANAPPRSETMLTR